MLKLRKDVPRVAWVGLKRNAEGPKLNYFVVQFIFWGPSDVGASTLCFGGEHVCGEGLVYFVDEMYVGGIEGVSLVN